MTKVIHDLLLTENLKVSRHYFILTLKAPEPLPEIFPGQFAEIQVPGNIVFLRRPFSVYDVDYQENTLSFLIKAIGQGTQALAASPAGTIMNTIYPLGKGFSLPSGRQALLAGGGVGIAPMLLLGKYLINNGCQPQFIFGGRSKEEIVQLDRFRSLGPVHITTDDGSMGHHGLITQHPVFQNLRAFNRVYACGPDPMMKAIAILCCKTGTDCEVSLENTMACGIGVCLSCVVETKEGNQAVCTAGPVFNTSGLDKWYEAGTAPELKPL